MKKKIIVTITMLCLLTVLYNYLRLPDYHITNSISFSSADTTLEIKLYYPTYYFHNNSKPFQTTTIEYNKKE